MLFLSGLLGGVGCWPSSPRSG